MKKMGFSLSSAFFPLGLLCALSLLWAGGNIPKDEVGYFQDTTAQQADIQIPPPPFSEDIYPCSECHADMETNPERRELEDFHDDIILKHDEKNRWCMDCHDAENRDMLHSASGELIDFRESYKLCGQCHGPKLRDWKAGIHGRRIGNWNGQKEYLLCAHCHNPHSPKYQSIKPDPVPEKPGRIK